MFTVSLTWSVYKASESNCFALQSNKDATNLAKVQSVSSLLLLFSAAVVVAGTVADAACLSDAQALSGTVRHCRALSGIVGHCLSARHDCWPVTRMCRMAVRL